MKKYFYIGAMSAILMVVFSFYIGCAGQEKIRWPGNGFAIQKISPHALAVTAANDPDSEIFECKFDFAIYGVYPNPEFPIALVATVAKQYTEGIDKDGYGSTPPEFMECKSYILDLVTKKIHPYADSWGWVSNNVVVFSGGACGTFLHYLFYIDKKRLEIFCARYQKPGYGCPEHVFLPFSEYEKKLLEIRGALD